LRSSLPRPCAHALRQLTLIPADRFLFTSSSFFFFNDTATTEIYTLSLHDALPISAVGAHRASKAIRHRARRFRDRACSGDGGRHGALGRALCGPRRPGLCGDGARGGARRKSAACNAEISAELTCAKALT